MRDSHKEFTNGQSQHYLVAVLGVVAGLFVAIPSEGYIRTTATSLSLVSIGYGFGVGAAGFRGTKLQHDLNIELHGEKEELETSHQRRVMELEGEIENYRQKHEEVDDTLREARIKLTEFQQELEVRTSENHQLETKRRALEASLIALREQFQEAVKRQVQKEASRHEEEKLNAVAKIKAAYIATLQKHLKANQEEFTEKTKRNKARHKEKEQQLLSEISQIKEHSESLQAYYDQREQQLQEHYTQLWDEARDRYDELIADYDAIIEQYQPQLVEINALFSAKYQSMTEERDRVYAQLQSYHQAKLFTGSTKADINGNRLINFFLQRKIVCDAIRCVSHFEYDEIWIRPRVMDLDNMKSYSQEIHMDFELIRSPEFHVEQGAIKVTLRTHTKEKSATTTEIEERPNWLEIVVAVSNHYRLVAPTDSGKSVLLDNLNNCLKLHHGSSFRFDLLDPKYPFSEWNNLTPTRKGFKECITGFRKIADVIDSRIAEATRCVEAVPPRPIPSYPAHLFAVDEAEMLVDECRMLDNRANGQGQNLKELTLLFRRGLKMGRGITKQKGKGIILAYVVQTPLSSRIGLNKDEFDNSTNIFIYEAIPRALEEELSGKLSNNQIAYLKKQYELRKERGDRYFALVKTATDCFIATLPGEGEYAAKLALKTALEEPTEINLQEEEDIFQLSDSLPMDEESQEESTPKCPHCGHDKYNKNGKKRGIQNYICKNCRKQFTLD